MSKYLIRPHHMLCMQFFEGKGYSDGFVASMAAIKEKLEKEDPQVEIVEGTDDVCKNCPHNMGGACESVWQSNWNCRKQCQMVKYYQSHKREHYRLR